MVPVEDVQEEDCGDSSGDEDGRERFFDSAPTKRGVEEEWEECAIPVDAREAAGIQSRKAGLRGTLEGEPILTLFSWFFPMQLYMSHLMELAARKPGPRGSRHNIPWNKGTFLRFLGLLIRASIMPLPNLEWHWRWPKHLPKINGWTSAKEYMSETVFMRYWRYATIPGVYGGVEEAELDSNGRTAVYNALKILLEACVRCW